MRKGICIISSYLLLMNIFCQEDIYIGNNGLVLFQSNAPLEMIKAESTYLRSAIDGETSTFAFTLSIQTFEGFNSPLQRVHFNENYLESHLYPSATFTGQFIEQLHLDTPGVYEVRAKGKLNIHGVNKERILKGKLSISPGEIRLTCGFTVLLEDHDILVPKIVKQKIADEIVVSVEAMIFKRME